MADLDTEPIIWKDGFYKIIIKKGLLDWIELNWKISEKYIPHFVMLNVHKNIKRTCFSFIVVNLNWEHVVYLQRGEQCVIELVGIPYNFWEKLTVWEWNVLETVKKSLLLIQNYLWTAQHFTIFVSWRKICISQSPEKYWIICRQHRPYLCVGVWYVYSSKNITGEQDDKTC